MNDYQKKTLKIVLGVIFLIASLALVIVGHRIGTNAAGLGLGGLAMEFGGLAGILILLGIYNHGFNK